jgi:hypothetical protein
MKRLSIALTAALLISSLTTPTAVAAIKAGGSCSKVGSSATSAGKRFTCIKSGKKYIWDKGVVVAKPVTLPTASPTPTPKLEPVVVDTKWYGWNFRFNPSGVLERKGGPVTQWSSSPSRTGQVIDPIRQKAFASILEYSKTAPTKAGKVNFAFGPNLASDVVTAYRNYFDLSIKFFESRIPEGTVLNVLVVSEKDDAFTKETLTKFLGDQSQANDVFKRSEIYLRQFETQGKQWSGGGSVSSFGPGKPLLYFGYACSCFASEDLLMYNVAHEITHYFQIATTPNVKKQNFTGNYPNWVEGKVYVPNSLMEGSANTLGSALIVPYVGWYSDQMDWHLGRYKGYGKIKELTNVDDTVKLMQAVESYLLEPSGLNDLNYSLGQLMFEYYIAQYGVVSYLDLFDNIEKFGDFDSALQKTVNTTKLDFYRDSAPYVMKAFNAVTS